MSPEVFRPGEGQRPICRAGDWDIYEDNQGDSDCPKPAYFALHRSNRAVRTLNVHPLIRPRPGAEFFARLVSLGFPESNIHGRRNLDHDDVEILWLRAENARLQRAVEAAGLAA